MTYRSQKLKDSAKKAPHCMNCKLENPNGDLLCLAHSNSLAHGRGAYHKSADYFGAILCKDCHDLVDGRLGALSKNDKRALWYAAWEATIAWWFESGAVK